MIPEGFVEYQRREYCNDIQCPIQHLLNQHENGSTEYEGIRKICQAGCLQTAYEFHHWVMEHGYLMIRSEK